MKLLDKVLRKNSRIEQMVSEAINVAEDEDIYKAKVTFLSMLEKHPEIRKELLLELGVRVDDDEQAPNEFLDKVALEITQNKEIPDSVLDDTVSDKLTDDGIKNLILKGNMAIFRQELLAKKIQDVKLQEEMQTLIEKRREKNQTEEEKKKEKEDYEKLGEVYDSCQDLAELDIIEKIRNLKINPQDKKSKNRIEKIIAKKMANNYFNFGTTTIPTLSKLMPVEEMFAENMPILVETEWQKILREKPDRKSNYQYAQGDLQKKLLKHIANKSVSAYLETGRFSIPQSQKMHELTKEEESDFIKSIEKELGTKLSRMQLKDVHAQVRGIIGINDTIEKFEENLVDIPKERLEKFLDFCTELLNDDSLRGTFEMLQTSGVAKKLKVISPEQRKDIIQGFATVLDHREEQVKNTYQVAPVSPKIKKNSAISKKEEER